MKRIDEISPIKDLTDLTEIVAEEIFKIADQYLPQDCFWRKGEEINIEVLCFITLLLKENAPITTDTICFHCSVEHSSCYEDCRHKSVPSQHFH